MSDLLQMGLGIGEAESLEVHIKSHRTDVGFVERKQGKKRKCEPTKCLPGTWDKVEVLRQRLENGEPLSHPDDAKLKRKRSGWEAADVPL
jgi:hypothetical protein